MADQNLYPCGRISRRHFLHQSIGGFLGGALGALWAEDGKLDARLPGGKKAEAVIFLFMCGGVSHIDTFDPKDNKYAGKLIDAIGFGDNVAEMKRPVIPLPAHVQALRPIGHSGLGLVSPRRRRDRRHRGRAVDVVPRRQSLPGGHRNADRPSRPAFDHPTFGSWVSYALGTANKNLPTFVNIGRASSPVQLTGGYLGATFAATPFQAGDAPIPNL